MGRSILRTSTPKSFTHAAASAALKVGRKPLTRLVYVSDQARGIRRVRLPVRDKKARKNSPPRFHYLGPSGRRIRDTRTLARIARLAIPPAYEDVWICSNPRGHLQATGRDARGRKQYRYHPDWRIARDDHKH